MEKKIIFTEVEPSKNFLWLHTKNGNLVLEVCGNKGWESIGDDSEIEKVTTTVANLKKTLEAQKPSPIKVKIPKITEKCSKEELIDTVNSLVKILSQANIITLK